MNEQLRHPGAAGLRLHHSYRATAWLGEELERAGDGELGSRCVTDEIEERLFERSSDLFTDLSLVFMDTTILSFLGTGLAAVSADGAIKVARLCDRFEMSQVVGCPSRCTNTSNTEPPRP